MMIPLLCICAIVIGFDRKLKFLYYEKANFKGLYLYKDKLLGCWMVLLVCLQFTIHAAAAIPLSRIL